VSSITSGSEKKVKVVDKTNDTLLGEHFEQSIKYYAIWLSLAVLVTMTVLL
jgi:hypothetical protein